MRIGRFVGGGHETPFWGVISPDGNIQPIVGSLPAWAPLVVDEGIDAVTTEKKSLPLDALTVLAPFDLPGRVFACGGNYIEHLRAAGFLDDPPRVPVAYLKVDSSIIGTEVAIRYPSYTEQLDYEVELVGVIGRPLRAGEAPSAALLGYTVGNDVSVRDAPGPLGGLDFYVMKAADGISPLGPWIVTPDELDGPGQPALKISLSCNGELRQIDNTKNVLFDIDELLTYVDERNRLRAGDILFTGTPSGTAYERGDGYLEPGDLLVAEIEGIGVLCNAVGERETPGAGVER